MLSVSVYASTTNGPPENVQVKDRALAYNALPPLPVPQKPLYEVFVAIPVILASIAVTRLMSPGRAPSLAFGSASGLPRRSSFTSRVTLNDVCDTGIDPPLLP